MSSSPPGRTTVAFLSVRPSDAVDTTVAHAPVPHACVQPAPRSQTFTRTRDRDSTTVILRPGAASTPGNAGHPTHRKPANGPPARPPGLARGRRRTDSRRFAAKLRALRGEDPRKGSLPPHRLHRRLLRSRGLLLPHGAALHALHGLRLLAALAHRLAHSLAHRLRHEY